MFAKPFCIKAVLFDFDGTLTKPGALDFVRLKETIGCPADAPVLEFIEGLSTPEQRATTLSVLERFEADAAADSVPNTGAEDLIRFLRAKGLGLGIITRNQRQSLERTLQNFATINSDDFDVIISRETPVARKPNPAGIKLAASIMNVDVKEILMVGDYLFDIQAGRRAGAITAFLDHGIVPKNAIPKSDFTITRLQELKQIIHMGLPLPQGKLPNDILEEFLNRFHGHDASVLIRKGVGEDAAAVDIDREQVLVLKSDPITFATDAIGHYAVVVNANDIAACGATPRWFLTSLLFPTGTSASGIWQVMYELESVCLQYDITLCGGHTEITDAVTRPVITGMLAGTVSKTKLVDKGNIRPGDRVLLTKAVAVEGTAIIAREFGSRLKALGVADSEIATCRQFLSRISILQEAQIASRSEGVSAMHDVTEGGLATALEELSIAGRHRIKIDMDKIPVFPQTEKICRLLAIEPLGLIGSGSLLICCRKKYAETLMLNIRNAGIEVTCIGNVLDPGRGVEAVNQAGPAEWSSFEVDEITRLF